MPGHRRQGGAQETRVLRRAEAKPKEDAMSGGPVTEFDRVVRTVCSPNCLGTCGVNAFVKDDQVVKLEPASFPDPGFERICLRGIAMATQRINHPERLTHPLMRTGARGENKWRRVTWDE